jgi:predicted CXXCH cytochrome family protein
MNHSSVKRLWALAAVAVVLAVPACSDDDESTTTPPTLDETFVGYSNPTSQQTVCGNCHIEKQRGWQATGHAVAWNSLQASGHAASYCNGCHTVSGYSNSAPDTTGFFAVDTAAQKYYYDVQCESCHGPGAAHVSGPEANKPQAPISADTALTVGCGTCHEGAHHPFVEEWRESRHGILNAYPAGRPECQRCHEGKGAVLALDPQANFAEKGSTTLQPIVCAVCHDPHGSDNDGNLRYPLDERDLNNNLCMRCHNNRAVPVGGSSRGNQGHGVQGAVLLGTAGWIPPGFTYDTNLIETSHSGAANPRLCAGCHVVPFTVTDNAGNFVSNATGHLFNPIPCIDPVTGEPTEGPCSVAEKSFKACVASGCHASENSARGAFLAESTTVQLFVNTLWVDVDGDKVIDTIGVDQGMLPWIKKNYPTAINPSDATITAADGAEFNVRFTGPNLADHPDGSRGAHNPFYYEALLVSTINYLPTAYPGVPAPPADVRALLSTRARRLGMTR